MNVTAFIRKTTNRNKATIYFRVRDHGCDIKAASELTINPAYWDTTRQGYKPRVSLVQEAERQRLNTAVQDLTRHISAEYHIGANSEWLKRTIFVFHHPNAYRLTGESGQEQRLAVLVEQYIQAKGFEKRQATSIRGLVGKIERYERYRQEVERCKGYQMLVGEMTHEDLESLQRYLTDEHLLYNRYPSLFADIGKLSGSAERSGNTLHTVFVRLRTIVKWGIQRGTTKNNPFDRFEIPKCLYGDPFYLSIEERDRLYHFDLSGQPHLAVFRDMFIFQCFVGCRYGDLTRIGRDNITGGVLQYLPEKTKNRTAKIIRVPLSEKAMAIFAKYEGRNTKTLFPHYNVSDYNKGVRVIMRMAGIDRTVSTLNPRTRAEEKRPLYEVATSHTARKTFIGNLYKQVKDPALISSMSGHADGSRAFARYRTIDDDIKRELVKMID